MRVMKDRKAMTHNELVQEVIRQLVARFQEMHRQLACGCAERVADAVLAETGACR